MVRPDFLLALVSAILVILAVFFVFCGIDWIVKEFIVGDITIPLGR